MRNLAEYNERNNLYPSLNQNKGVKIDVNQDNSYVQNIQKILLQQIIISFCSIISRKLVNAVKKMLQKYFLDVLYIASKEGIKV